MRLHVDLSRRYPQPGPAALAVAVAVAVVGSVAADRLLIWLWTGVAPTDRGYGHFRFADYATLTAFGVLAAGAAWPMVCRICPTPRWLFLRLAGLVTLVLWIPDLVLLIGRQPPPDVAVLMVLHVLVAVVTYHSLVRLAPPRAVGEGEDTAPVPTVDPLARRSTVLAVLVGVEFGLGVATLVLVPSGRSTGWWPEQGTVVYGAHALVGLPLTVLAVHFLLQTRRSLRLLRLGGWIGGVGVAIAGAGGVLAVSHPLRLVGVALMLVGPVAAAFGYLIPTFDRLSERSVPDGSG